MLHFPFAHRHESEPSERVELLGGKGAGLAMMAGELALPVPPGFTLTTRACAAYLERGWTAEHEAALRAGVSGIESVTGHAMGDVERPLLLSVRSGALDSMPGMLDSVLNVGLNDATLPGFATPNADFARDCRERLEASFEASVGERPPEDPWLQLRCAIEAVFRSVRSSRVQAYRSREGLGDEVFTAVNVQTMVFGNRDESSATGVLFSRDPATGEARLYGDVLFRAQGEDVVSGRRETEPIESLGRRLPEAAAQLRAVTQRLECQLRDLCEIEFTIESGQLWLLQVRVGKRSARAGLRIATELAADPDLPLDRREAVERVLETLANPPRIVTVIEPRTAQPLARGVAASPGVASGEVVVDVDSAVRQSAQGRSVILVRPETSPSDVEGMSLARGLLTSRGGLASHAAVIARGWGVPAVVGVQTLTIEARGIMLGSRRIEIGETISIDGSSGAVYAGTIRALEEPAPEVAPLLESARDLGIAIPESRKAVETEVGPVANRSSGAVAISASNFEQNRQASEDAIVRSLSIRGASMPDSLAASLGVPAAALEGSLSTLEATGQVAPAKPFGVGLTESGNERAAELIAADRATLGRERAVRTLDAFQRFDARLKQAVSDWQLRLVAGEMIPNDHTDAAWDEGVLARLAEIVKEVGPWLDSLASDLPRVFVYAERLAAALVMAGDGDGRFVASPRVDSLHGIWFELHEDLIRLAGRTRADEAAAGRAG